MLRIYDFLVKKRNWMFIYMMALLGVFGWGLLLWEIPTEIYISEGEEVKLEESLPVTFEQESIEEVFFNKKNDQYQIMCKFMGVIPVKSVSVHVVEEKEVVPVGQVVGIILHTDGVYVVDTESIETQTGDKISPCAKQLRAGDYITQINDIVVDSKEDVMQAVETSNGKALKLTLRRDGKEVECSVTPVMSNNHSYKLGVWIKDDIVGVGTITYMDEDGHYGALGHGINSTETKNLIEITSGSLYETEIASINKGEKGAPGSLVGMLYIKTEDYYGTVKRNNSTGIYGATNQRFEALLDHNAIPIAHKQEIKTGPAEIYSCVDGVVCSYEIEIEDIVMNSPEANKSLLFRVTDEELIRKTGGIVQGMSGSPIIQDGKLVGAVTHVLVNDPTRGYGIFIENMLDAAG